MSAVLGPMRRTYWIIFIGAGRIKARSLRELLRMLSRGAAMEGRADPKTALCIVYVAAMFTVAMDATVLNVALKTISQELQVPPAASGVLNVGYLVSLAVVLPAAGWLGDKWGTKRTFFYALAFLRERRRCARLRRQPDVAHRVGSRRASAAACLRQSGWRCCSRMFSRRSRQKLPGRSCSRSQWPLR